MCGHDGLLANVFNAHRDHRYTGHAINLHYSAPETYAYVFEWLSQHGL